MKCNAGGAFEGEATRRSALKYDAGERRKKWRRRIETFLKGNIIEAETLECE